MFPVKPPSVILELHLVLTLRVLAGRPPGSPLSSHLPQTLAFASKSAAAELQRLLQTNSTTSQSHSQLVLLVLSSNGTKNITLKDVDILSIYVGNSGSSSPGNTSLGCFTVKRVSVYVGFTGPTVHLE